MWQLLLTVTMVVFGLAGHAAHAEDAAADHFSAADTNHDGNLTREEVQAYYTHMFDALDVTGDGRLDRDECDYGCVMFKPGKKMDKEHQVREEDIAKEVKAQFDILDKDGDQALSKDEYLNYFEDELMKLDKNKDRKITRKEYGER